MGADSKPNTAMDQPAEIGPERPRRWAVRAAWASVSVMLFCGMLLAGVWATAALYFDFPVRWLGVAAAILYAAGVTIICLRIHRLWRKALLGLALFGVVLAWWLTLSPSNDRDWQPDVAVLGWAERNGQEITVHNVRNCDYRTETEYTVRHYDKTFNLDKLQTLDLFQVYWGSPHIAHTMFSFGFEGGDYLCFSVETRKEKGEGYSAVKGLFRQFEVVYVVADERDVVRLRTNFRKCEDVYLYRMNAAPEQVRSLFLSFIDRLNALRSSPEWYNAISRNCTTSIRMQRTTAQRAPWDWRMLVNGHGDELLYERGAVSTNLPLAELKRASHVNARAVAAGDSRDFSGKIREGVPGVTQ